MICLLLPPSLLTPINLRRRRVFVSSLFSFFSVFLLVCFPSNIFSFILSRVLSPLFSPVLSVLSLSLHPSDRNFSFVFPRDLSLSLSLFFSVHPMYRSSSFTPWSVFLSSALSLQPSIRLLSFLSMVAMVTASVPVYISVFVCSRPLHLHVHPFRKH